MNSLGSPVDAMALDYLGFSFFPVVINNIWTWVAVITAAVSFWRIRAVASVALKFHDTEDIKSSLPLVSAAPPHTEAATEPVKPLASSTTTSSTRAPRSAVDVDTTEGLTRGKFFTAYYEEDEVAWEGEVVDDGGVEEVGSSTGGGGDNYYYLCDNWEKVMRMRMEPDMGSWYRYQDLTVLDGNVVRLWDGCRGDKTTISLY